MRFMAKRSENNERQKSCIVVLNNRYLQTFRVLKIQRLILSNPNLGILLVLVVHRFFLNSVDGLPYKRRFTDREQVE